MRVGRTKTLAAVESFGEQVGGGQAAEPTKSPSGSLQFTVAGMLRGMSEVGGSGGKAQELKAQVTRKVREVRAQAIARAPQLTGVAAQRTQRVVQDKPGAAVGAALAVLGLLILRRRPRRREKGKKAQQVRGRSRTSRVVRWARVLAVLGFVVRRRRRRGREEGS